MKDLLVSRKFWAMVIGLFVLLVGQFVFSAFNLDEEATAGLIIIIVSYLIGVSVDPGPGGWRGWIKSRKFWASIVGLVGVVLKGFGVVWPVDLPPETVIWFAILVGGYVSSIAVADRVLLNEAL